MQTEGRGGERSKKILTRENTIMIAQSARQTTIYNIENAPQFQSIQQRQMDHVLSLL